MFDLDFVIHAPHRRRLDSEPAGGDQRMEPTASVSSLARFVPTAAGLRLTSAV